MHWWTCSNCCSYLLGSDTPLKTMSALAFLLQNSFSTIILHKHSLSSLPFCPAPLACSWPHFPTSVSIFQCCCSSAVKIGAAGSSEMAKLSQITCYHMPQSDHKICLYSSKLQQVSELHIPWTIWISFSNICISKLPGNKSRCYPIKDFISR